MNNDVIHKMIRVFVGYGEPLVIDDIGANKPDYPFFNRLASQETIDDYQLVEASERFYKYRNTQLPQLLRDAGLIEHASEVNQFLLLMKEKGERGMIERQRIQEEQNEADKRMRKASALISDALRRGESALLLVNEVANALKCEHDEALAFIEQGISLWKPPTSLQVHFSQVDDKWTNRWGNTFTNKRIALHYEYNPSLNNVLKNELGFPAIKFDGKTKLWTLQDDVDVINNALRILAEFRTSEGYILFVDEESLKRINVSATKQKSIERSTETKATLLNGGTSIEYDDDDDDDDMTPLLKLADVIQGIPEVADYMEERAKRIAISGASSLDDKMIVAKLQQDLMSVFPEGRSLYPFQYVGVQFAQLSGGRCLIGDDMGIGKTIQAIAHIGLNQDKLPALVIVPASVKYNWLKECSAWLPDMTSIVLEGRSGTIPNADIVICNYDIVAGRQVALMDYGFNIVVCDESHYLKNNKAKRTQATLEIAKQSESVLCLSGTAITNRPNEFFTTLNLLRPNEFPSFFDYGVRYCAGEQTRFGWDFSGASNTDELHNRTRDFCIRRLKKEVLTELPDKIRTIHTVEPNSKEIKRYNELHRAWMEEYNSLETLPAGFVLNMLTALRHECGLIKVPSAVEYIKEYREITGKQLVVFAHHTDVLRDTANLLRQDKNHKWRIGGITGDMPAEKRQQNVEAFQNGQLDVILCSTVAAKEGITLTNADTVLFIEREWTPAWEEQAEDRVNRIGQESQSVQAVFLSVANTIDEKFNHVVENKRAVIQAVLDGGTLDEREGIASMLIKTMIEAGDLPADFLNKGKKKQKELKSI
jgi:SWI/SNF-related matrix-associated actin-dependent regulator 1 of chromatin subfamily A